MQSQSKITIIRSLWEIITRQRKSYMARICKLIYGDSEHCADLLYRIGVFIPDPIVWYAIDDMECIVVSPLEYARVKQAVLSGVEVLSYDAAKTRFGLKRLEVTALIAGISAFHRVKSWRVPPGFPLFIPQKLNRSRISFRTGKGAFFPERELKTAGEIEKITRGVRLAERGLAAALDVLCAAAIDADQLLYRNAPLTSEIVQGEINAVIARHGGCALHTIVAGGPQAADPHESGSGPLRPHQPIIIDIFPRVTATGYFGDLTRTVVKGAAPTVVRDAFAAVRAAVAAAKDTIRDGVDGRSAHKAAMTALTDAGFETDLKAETPTGFIHGTGHGLGLDIHEAPRVNSRKSILRTGHVVTVEPGVYYPDWGGLRIEDVVVVGAAGCDTLTAAPVYLEIP